MNLYTILEKLDAVSKVNESPLDWGKKLFKKEPEKKDGMADLERQAAQVRSSGMIKPAKTAADCNPDDEECLQRFQHQYKHPSQKLGGQNPPVIPSQNRMASVDLTQNELENALVQWILSEHSDWLRQYPNSAYGAIYDAIRKKSYAWSYILPEWYSNNLKSNTDSGINKVKKDDVEYFTVEEWLLDHIYLDVVDIIPRPQVFWSMDESAKSADNNIAEGAATVFSDAKGHHLKNADGEVVQSFEGTPEGLRQARNALYANYNVLSMEKPKESTMNEFEEKFNNALNESLTITTTAGTEQDDTVNVTATDEDAHTLVAILKAAGLPYKDREAQLVAATPCGEQVEEEYANEPNEVTMSTDFMVNKLAGGLNRAKSQYKKEYPGDNPMAVNEENLMRGLWDLYKKV